MFAENIILKPFVISTDRRERRNLPEESRRSLAVLIFCG